MGIPVISSALAIWAIVSYTLTEEKAHEVRQALERRRGKIAVVS
jgi:GPH family glycoside/pentoside/hexuronide:cation symporter